MSEAGFDHVAAFYDPLSRLVFGRALQWAQLKALESLPPGHPYVLIIGGGSGWVLPEALRQRPNARILYVESSPLMLVKARETLLRRVPTHATQVEFRLGTEAVLGPHESFDAIVTFFFLDLFSPARLREVLAQLAAVRRPHAPLLLADFRPAQTLWQRGLLRLMYAFFRLTTGISARQLPPIHAELARFGLRPQRQLLFFHGMVEATVFDAA
ncbi:Methyltransferase domain-containing protein [Hymenobacter daecheongensis DSM 21074]|uniref:Methyltransferase domain-containing protein n=1 Tax=Hymenobacter daecheongensis DSM 21074 TaxID=1121955 RepID=A0A1M6LSB4_9BACT|nr:class I SAM-dependent methyltransferase [Hymenobacter daecheongensis]SHJ74144.1 Methyltransferase domain-containing protein [Hymenobacter daecheongensis DSM 21074]